MTLAARCATGILAAVLLAGAPVPQAALADETGDRLAAIEQRLAAMEKSLGTDPSAGIASTLDRVKQLEVAVECLVRDLKASNDAIAKLRDHGKDDGGAIDKLNDGVKTIAQMVNAVRDDVKDVRRDVEALDGRVDKLEK